MSSVEFAAAVKSARAAAGLSVREARGACGLAKSHYERLEAGAVRAPTVATIDALARGLGVQRSVLLRAAGYV